MSELKSFNNLGASVQVSIRTDIEKSIFPYVESLEANKL